MAVKHILDYYKSVEAQYIEMLNDLKEMEEEVNNKVLPPEALDNIKTMIEPLKNNYMTLSWVMFLLNQPNRDSKKNKYIRQSKKFTSTLDPEKSKDGIIKENEKVLESTKKGLI